MRILYDPACGEYDHGAHAEAPFRTLDTAARLRASHPQWFEAKTHLPPLDDSILLRAHTPVHLARLRAPSADFDGDTPATPQIETHARRAAAGAVAAAGMALAGERVFALQRPPGHHATADRAMGFCYLNGVAIAALHAVEALGARRVAVWDFDAHHGNGTEAILAGRAGFLYVSVHQSPCYPGTGQLSEGNARNYPVAPGTPAAGHLRALEASWGDVLAFQPDLILVSAGFDAYAGDPITDLRLQPADFAQLGAWVRECGLPAAAILEGGYSRDLPLLIEPFLEAWEGPA